MNINLKKIGQFENGLVNPKLEASLQLLLISLVFACSTLCSRGDDAVLSADSLAQIIAASESQLHNLKVTAKQVQMLWDESLGKWKDAGDASFTMWLDGTPGGKMRIDFQHRRSLWTDGAKPFFTDSCVLTYNGQAGQVLERVSEEVLTKNKNARPRGNINADRPNMSVADCGSGWIASLYGVEEGRKMHFSKLIELIRIETNIPYSFTIVSTNYMASPYYIVSTNNRIVSTNYIFSTKYNGLACKQVTLEEYKGILRTDWFLDPSRNYALLGYKKVTPRSSTECVVEELIEPAPGVFYPKKAAFYVVGRDGKPKSLITYEGVSIVANDPNFSDDIFTIQWPTGTTLHDEVLDTTFEISPPSGELATNLNSQVSGAKKAVSPK